MRYAIFSDVHANLQAWTAVRQDMVECGADVLVCLGDVVGYGPMPEEVLKSIRSATQNFVMGNHDAAAAGLMDTEWFNPEARSVVEWTRDQLSEESLAFLRDLPLTIESDEMFFTHAEIVDPGGFKYIKTAKDARAQLSKSRHLVTFIGHTHSPKIFVRNKNANIKELPDADFGLETGNRYIVNVGSVGEPRDAEDLRARYVIYDSDAREVYFRRVEFDPEAYRQDLLATTLDVRPYFLQVIDHEAAEAEQALIDKF